MSLGGTRILTRTVRYFEVSEYFASAQKPFLAVAGGIFY